MVHRVITVHPLPEDGPDVNTRRYPVGLLWFVEPGSRVPVAEEHLRLFILIADILLGPQASTYIKLAGQHPLPTADGSEVYHPRGGDPGNGRVR